MTSPWGHNLFGPCTESSTHLGMHSPVQRGSDYIPRSAHGKAATPAFAVKERVLTKVLSTRLQWSWPREEGARLQAVRPLYRWPQ